MKFSFPQSVNPKGANNATKPEVKAPAKVEEKPVQNSNNAQQGTPAPFQIIIPGKGAVSNSQQTAQSILSTKQEQASPAKQEQAPQALQLSTGLNYPDQVEGVDPAIYKEFLEAKHVLHDCLNQKAELIGLALRRVMVSLQEHPELAEFMLPEDQGAMIKSLRHSYNVTLAIKAKKKRKKKDAPEQKEFDISDLASLVVE